MSDRKARLTITVDPYLSAYAERLVEAGKAPAKVARMMAYIDTQADQLPKR